MLTEVTIKTIMDCRGVLDRCKKRGFFTFLDFSLSNQYSSSSFQPPLSVDEVMSLLRHRWGVAYDLQIVVRGKNLYLQLMWRFLEQQSFPLDEDSYKIHLNQVLEIINRLGMAGITREWLAIKSSKPRLGRAITLPLKSNDLIGEFIL